MQKWHTRQADAKHYYHSKPTTGKTATYGNTAAHSTTVDYYFPVFTCTLCQCGYWLCLVSMSVCHNSVFYQNGWTNCFFLTWRLSLTYSTVCSGEIQVFTKIRVPYRYFPQELCPVAFRALTMLVGRQEGHPAWKNWAVGCWHGYLPGARCRLAYVQLMPLPLTVSCFSKIQIGFTFLAHPGSPGQRAVKLVCVCVCELCPKLGTSKISP